MKAWALLAWSCAACASPPPEWPERASLTIDEVGTDRVAFSWPAAQNADAYVVRIDGAPSARIDERTYVADGFDEVSEHTFEVVAVGAGESTPLRETVRTADGTAPVLVNELRLSAEAADAAGARTVVARWAAARDNVGVVAYRVLRDGDEVARVTGTEARIECATLRETTRFEIVALDAADNASTPIATLWGDTLEASLERQPVALSRLFDRLLSSRGSVNELLRGSASTTGDSLGGLHRREMNTQATGVDGASAGGLVRGDSWGRVGSGGLGSRGGLGSTGDGSGGTGQAYGDLDTRTGDVGE